MVAQNIPAETLNAMQQKEKFAGVSNTVENAKNESNNKLVVLGGDSLAAAESTQKHLYGDIRNNIKTTTLSHAETNPSLGKPLDTQHQPIETAVSRDHSNCWDVLDNVTHSHVTNEGKTFTEEQLELAQYANQEPLIPRILHQTWDDYNIPSAAVPFVKSMLKHNPAWQYWFWTQADVKCYLQQKHPDFVNLYNSYQSTIFRTDVMRYFLLYDYGGVYLDLDVECLKPLDIWTQLAPAVLAHETYEHVFIMHRLKEPNVMTTILATRAGHPYYKLLQDNLEKFHLAKRGDVLHSTGPYFLNDVFNIYMSEHRNVSRPEDDILVIHPKYWLPTFDKLNLTAICSCPLLRDGLLQKKTGEKIKRNPDTLLLCKIARDRNWFNGPYEESFLDHHWVHTNIAGNIFKKPGAGRVDIRTIIPDFVPVPERLGISC